MNEIHITLEEKEIDGKMQHHIDCRINVTNDHHFLDMLNAILNGWHKSNHKEQQ